VGPKVENADRQVAESVEQKKEEVCEGKLNFASFLKKDFIGLPVQKCSK
jgi:hypothetical protein